MTLSRSPLSFVLTFLWFYLSMTYVNMVFCSRIPMENLPCSWKKSSGITHSNREEIGSACLKELKALGCFWCADTWAYQHVFISRIRWKQWLWSPVFLFILRVIHTIRHQSRFFFFHPPFKMPVNLVQMMLLIEMNLIVYIAVWTKRFLHPLLPVSFVIHCPHLLLTPSFACTGASTVILFSKKYFSFFGIIVFFLLVLPVIDSTFSALKWGAVKPLQRSVLYT